MPGRPESDRPLDERIALSALREQFPELPFHQVIPLPAGWATDPYLVDDQFVARFPRNAEIAEWLGWDQAVLEFVDSSLGSAVRVPRVLRRGSPGEYFPHGFLLCEFVPGIPHDRPEAPTSDLLAADLGEALTHIHSVSAVSAADIGVTQPEWATYEGPLSFVHGDFSPANIIVDASTGRLAGIIDWGNAALGERALDFHKLVLDCGWEFTRDVLEAYGLPVDEEFIGRIGGIAQYEAAQWLLDAVQRGKDPTRNLKWVRNAFSVDGAF